MQTQPITSWQQGLPLNKAKLKYISEEQRSQLEAMREEQQDSRDDLADMLYNWPDYDEMPKSAQEMKEWFEELDHFENEIEEQIRTKLKSGQLDAFGFVSPRHPSSKPEKIPNDVFDGDFSWAHSEIAGNGIRFVAVRIIEACAENNLRSPGRPSARDMIVTAYEDLNKGGQIDRQKSLASHFGVIRRKIIDAYSVNGNSPQGLSDKALYAHLGPIFKSEK